jgi:hypothetical protein
MRRALTLIILLAVAWPAAAVAQSPEPESPESVEEAESDEDSAPKTTSPYVSGELQATPKDGLYGDQPPTEDNVFPESLTPTAPVDEPMKRTSMGDKNIIVPSAATPDQGTWVLTTHNLLVNHVSYGLEDDIEMTLGFRIPTARADWISTFSTKFKLADTRNYALSIQPFAAYSNGIRTLDTSQFGLGSGILFDWKVHETVVVHFGGYGYANMVYSYNERDTSGCGTRSEFGPDCIEVTSQTEAFPAGGHWISGSTGVTWFVGDDFSVHAEFLLGGVAGTFFGVEDNAEEQNQEVPEPVDRSPFEDPTFKPGFPHGSGPTWSLGVGYSIGDVALQADFVMFRNIDDPSTVVVDESQEIRLLPVAALSYAF